MKNGNKRKKVFVPFVFTILLKSYNLFSGSLIDYVLMEFILPTEIWISCLNIDLLH